MSMNHLESECTTSQLSELGPAPTVGQVAEFFNQHPSTVYRHLYAGDFEIIKGFGRVRICPRSIEKFLGRVEVYTPRKRRQEVSK
jgi:Helix-turn-helix domain